MLLITSDIGCEHLVLSDLGRDKILLPILSAVPLWGECLCSDQAEILTGTAQGLHSSYPSPHCEECQPSGWEQTNK